MASFSNLPFTFTSGGYQKPSFDGVNFNWGEATQSAFANLQAAINVMGVYQDTTYTYLKECPKIVVGYTSHGVQILQLPCVYGGIRDLGASLFRLPPNVDLPAYIFALTDYKNLEAYLKPNIREYLDISSYVYGIPPSDLLGYIHGFDTRDLGGSLYGWALKNLGSIIGGHLPANITAILNVIEIRNLPANIEGVWWKGEKDLGAEFYKIWNRGNISLSSILHGWQEFDLPASIYRVFFTDLPAIILGSFLKNLSAYIYSIAPVDLSASLHGFDERFLTAVINGVYGPYDLRAYLNAIDPVNLPASIIGWSGYQVPFDLRAYLDGYGPSDLGAIINPLGPSDLAAYLVADGQAADLMASIIPKTIRLKRAIQVALLEHLDLKGLINFQCFSSTYSDLIASLYTIYKQDLGGIIWGWQSEDGYGDLGAYINAGEYLVQDKIAISLFASDYLKHSRLKIGFSTYDNSGYYTFDKLPIFTTSYYTQDLNAIVSGILRSEDLNASINVLYQPNYSELPPKVKPKRHVTVIDFDEDWHENWRRYVELSFDKGDKYPYHYFYVSGAGQIYKVDRSRHWSLDAKSYIKDEDNMIERRAIRNKSLSKLSSYANMDSAIRDLIDRAAIPRRVNLGAYISSIPPVHSDLAASLRPDVKYTWVKHLTSNIYGYGSVSVDIGALITGS